MRKFNKEEKVELLEYVMKTIENGVTSGFCAAFDVSASNMSFLSLREKKELGYNGHDSLSLVPEIMFYAPNGYRCDIFWFKRDKDGKQKRIEILKELIDKLNK